MQKKMLKVGYLSRIQFGITITVEPTKCGKSDQKSIINARN